MSIAFLSEAKPAMTAARPAPRRARSAGARSCVEPCAHRCRPRRRRARGSGRAARRRPGGGSSEEEMSMRGMSKKRTRSAAPEAREALERCRARRDALALGDAEPRELEDGLRLAPRRQRVGHVASDDEGQLVLRAGVMEPPRVSTVNDGPGDVDLERATRRGARRPPPRPAQLQPVLRRPGRPGLLVRRRVDRHEQRPGRARAAPAPPARRPDGRGAAG